MPNHQTRRAPLPADYQYPTHGVDCDCPPCRDRTVATRATMGFHPVYFTSTFYRGGKVVEGWSDSRVAEPTAETPWGV